MLNIIFLLYVYNVVISLFCFCKKDDVTTCIDRLETFTILIPCHNEEEVIVDTLNSVNNINYNNFTVYVIADNCSDSTVSKAIKLGANIIKVNGGSKPKALNKAVKWLKSNGKWVDDNIVVIDADNRVSKSILSTFNMYHCQGEKILQSRILSLNDKSFIAKGFTSSFNTMTENFQYARNRIGLSASLCGTGFSINRKVWDEVDFNNCSSLAEDLEFSILSILKGYKVKFVINEYVLNQNLDEFKPSIVQRLRWARGYGQVSIKLSFTLIKCFLTHPSLQIFDSLVFINTPSKSFLYIIFNILVLFGKTTYYIPMWLVGGLFIYNIIFILYSNKFKFKYIVPHLFFCICTGFILFWSVLTVNNKTWKKTKHKKIGEC